MAETNFQPYSTLGSKENGLQTHDTGVIGLHQENLFDQDERTHDGAYLNEADGKPYDNSTHRDEDLFGESEDAIGYVFDPDAEPDVDLELEGSDPDADELKTLALDTLTKEAREVDAADLWLAENDPTRAIDNQDPEHNA